MSANRMGCIIVRLKPNLSSKWWFHPNPAQILEYDYYGSYDNAQHSNYKYADKLKLDYTFDFPKHHELIKEECLGCRRGVAAFNMSYFGKFYITGPESQAAVDFIFSNNMRKPEGSTVYTCMLNSQGKVEADLTVSTISPGEGSACDPSFDGELLASCPGCLRVCFYYCSFAVAQLGVLKEV